VETLREDAPLSTPEFDVSFREAFDAHHASLLRYLARLSGDPALAADVAQETFVKLYRRGEMPDDLRSWLAAVATNMWRDEYRRGARRLRLLTHHALDTVHSDPAPAPDAELLRGERRGAIRALLGTLAPREQRLLLLRHEGYSYRELAAAVGVEVSSIGTLLARAHATLLAEWRRRTDAPE
jgi:RNA polymerase sigma factor (sigma-70 family)